MKRFLQMITLAIILAFSFSVAQAAEVLIDSKITDVKTKMDKNGRQFVRAIVQQDKSLNGNDYQVGTPVMFFGDLVLEAKNLKKGQNLKAICSTREYQGRTSYTVLKVLK